MTDNNSNQEREVQDMGDGDKDAMYEPLLDDINELTLMDDDDFEIEMGSKTGCKA